MTNTSVESTVAQLQPIRFGYEDDPDGFVAATIPVTWTFDEAAISYIAVHRHENPHLIVVVASMHEHEYDDYDYTAADKAEEDNPELSIEEYDALIKTGVLKVLEYTVTSVQAIALLNSAGQPTTAKAFVSFDRPDDNVIFGHIVSVPDERAMSSVRSWVRGARDIDIRDPEEPGEMPVLYGDGGDQILTAGFGTSFVNVQVPREMFAKEPPRALKALVRQYFRGREDDQCHFRKRVILSSLLSIPVQVYGLFVRVAVFLVAFLLLASRGTFGRGLFALNPHDYARSLGSSRWLKDANEEEYSLLRQVLSPIGLAGLCTILAAFLLPGVVWSAITDDQRATPVVILVFSCAFYGAALCIGLLGWMLFSRSGHRWFSLRIASPVADFAYNLRPSEEPEKRTDATGSEIREAITLLRQAQAATVAPSQVANTTFKLKFLDLKMKVCKPFAKPMGYR